MKRSIDRHIYRSIGIVALVVATLALSAAMAAATGNAIGWRQANTAGFGTPANYFVSTLGTLGSYLYAGTSNEEGAQVWRTADGQNWSQVTPNWTDTAETYGAVPFGSRLYVGTGYTGGAIWRTDGTTWQQVATAGLGDENNVGISALAEFDGAIYAATANWPPAIGGGGDGVEMWRSPSGNAGTWEQVNDDGFGAGPTWLDITMDVYLGHLYVGLSRVTDGGGSLAELWRTDGETWTPMFTDGLGDADNTHVAAMAEFKGELYIGLRNATTGGQVWRSANGLSWTPVFTDGLGDTHRSRPYGLVVYADRLLVVFSRTDSGAEVWQSADGLSWQQIAAGGWGDGDNGFAAYFDKADVLFRGRLYIGTMNNTTGGQIWERLLVVYLPLAVRSD